jgi:preprotein translocase subunit YajC
VQSVDSDSLQIRIAENVKIKIAKNAVAGLANDEAAAS